MAYRKSGSRTKGKLHPSQVLPIWGAHHQAAVNMAYMAMLERFGITDIQSYFRKLRIPIVISAIVCGGFGLSGNGLSGLLIGGLLGLIAPAGLLWLGVMLVGAAIFMAIYVAIWAVILSFLWWFIRA